MRRRNFFLNSEADVVLGHHDAPRISGLPVGYFDEVPFWRRAQRALLIAAVIGLVLLTLSCRS